MATMIEQILAQLPADELASRLGTDPATAMDAARKALPALLGGLSNEVASGKGDALATALQRDHDGSLLDQANPLAAIDTSDGEKIVGHIFGGQQGQVVRALGGQSTGNASVFSALLPMLAPLVMAWLGKQVGGASASGTSPAAPSSGGGLGGLLGGLLGGATGAQGGGLGGLLGGATGAQGGLGDLLGGVLGNEVDQTRSAMPDLGGLFDMLGGSGTTTEPG